MTDAPLGFQTISRTWANSWKGLCVIRPLTYIFVIFLASFTAYAYKFGKETIFACQAAMYSLDRYIAYCSGTHYADYDHGAFAFGLEPKAENFARDADVLFLGNSRLQYAFSTLATSDWFSAASARYYLLGFTYFENMIFAEELLRKIRPRATVYVINVDDFFDRTESPPVKTILHDPTARARYETKRSWQRVHELVCKIFAFICRNEFAIFRSSETGAYYADGTTKLWKTASVFYDEVISRSAVVDRNTANAIDFLKRFTKGRCVILTLVPFVGTKIGDANAIATGIGMKLVAPKNLEGLQTWDGYHLDQRSAARWSQAFFEAAGPEIQSCLEEHGASPP
jgi:hypothetical protein